MLKRMLSLMLSIALVLSMVPAQTLALETEATEPASETLAETTVPETTEAVTEPAETTMPPETEDPETTAPTAAETAPEEVPETTEETVPETTEETVPEETIVEETVAEEAEASGSCGSSATWSLSDGVLTISGTGTMTDYTYSSNAPWYASAEEITRIVIEEGITYIGKYTFYKLTNVTEAVIPSTVKTIGNHAFGYCSALAGVVLPDALTTIDYGAFYACTGLTEISIPASVTSIDCDAFRKCTGLTGVYITDLTKWCQITFGHYGANPLECGKNLYLNGEKITDLVIPSEIKTIGHNTFCGGSFETITFHSGVTMIDYEAFYNCDGITELNLPNSVTYISDFAFGNCDGIERLILPSSLKTIGENAFGRCDALRMVYIPSSVTSIRNCTGMIEGAIGNTGFQGVFTECDPSLTIYCGANQQPSGWLSRWNHRNFQEIFTTYWGVSGIPETDLASASIQTLPSTTRYQVGDEIDLTGLSLLVTDVEGNTFTAGQADGVRLYSGDTSAAGRIPVTVNYFGQLVQFDILVHEVETSEELIPDGVAYPESAHSYANNYDNTWTYTCSGASYLKLTFSSSTKTENNYDFIYIYDKSGTQIGKYSGTALTSKTVKVTGDTVKIRLTSDSSVNSYGFSLTSIYAYISGRGEVLQPNAAPYPQSPHDYANNYSNTWTYTSAGADYLKLTFSSSTMTENTCDFIYIFDKNDNQIGKYSGSTLKGKTVQVPGDTFKIRLSTDYSNTYYGFSFSSIHAGYYGGEIHVPTGEGVYTAPGCYTDGYTTHTCFCGQTVVETDEGSAGHRAQTVPAVAPTCTQPGLTEGSSCAGCGLVFTAQQTVAALGHTPGDAVQENLVAATCTTNGSYDQVVCCTGCGEEMSRQTITLQAEGHLLAEEVKTAPTCTEEGVLESHCTRSGCDHTKTEAIEALGHDVVTDGALAATCTSTGLTEGKHCERCSEILVAQTVVPALGHAEVTDAAVAPTCTTTGLTEGKHCARCETILVAQTVVPALGHVEVTDEAVEPTCTTTGLTEGKHCSRCKATLIAQTVIPALGHSYENGFCAVCAEYEPAVLKDGVYEISNAGQLYWFAAQVNGGETDLNGALTGDIVVNESLEGGSKLRRWVPIGSEEAHYQGCFDGRGYTVSGLIGVDGYKYTGFFGYLEKATISNVTVSNSDFYGGSNVGGIAGYNNGGKISGCISDATCGAFCLVGGIVGTNHNGVVKLCKNEGMVYTDGINAGNSAGGIAGMNIGEDGETALIQQCISSGTCGSYADAGGIVGVNKGTAVVENCGHTGRTYAVPGVHYGRGYNTGGIAGSNSEGAMIVRCSNTGKVDGENSCGGIAGSNAGQILNSYFDNSWIDNGIGGGAEDYAEQTAGSMDRSRFASGEVAWLLNGGKNDETTVWRQNIGTDTYPNFYGAIVYKNQIGGCTDTTFEYIYSNTLSMSATTHTEGDTVVENEKAAECENPGSYDNVVYCSACGVELRRETVRIDAKGHTEVIDEAVAPDCVNTGLTEGKHCSVCSEILIAQEEVPALGHTEGQVVKENEIAPGCVEPGSYDNVVYCTVCGEKLHRETATVEPLGHDYLYGICQVCGHEIPADYTLYAGKSMTIKLTNPATGKAYTTKELTWSLAQEFEPFATLKNGKLTAKKVPARARMEISATVVATQEKLTFLVDIYPAVTQVEAVVEGQTVANNGTVLVDFMETTKTIQINTYPEDTLETVQWTVSDKKGQYATYEMVGDTLTVTAPTGKAGTVTVKATVDAGVKKTVTVKLNFGSFAKTVTIFDPPKTTLRGGETLELQAYVSAPENVTKAGVVWSVSDKNAASVSSAGKVTAKNVAHPTVVTITATSKDGQAKASVDLTIIPKNEGQLVIMDGGRYVTNTTRAMNVNGTYRISAALVDNGEAVPVEVTWTTSKDTVATVANGTITATGAGTAKITAEYNGMKAVLNVKVSTLVEAMTITTKDGKNLIEENGEMMVQVSSGKSVTLAANILTQGAAKTVDWAITEGGAYAKISSGKLTANKDLTSVQYVTVKATAKDGSGTSATIRVKILPLATGVRIYQNGTRIRSNTVYISDLVTEPVLKLSAKVYPAKADQTVLLTSSNKKVADFVNGQLVCYKTGTVTITAAAQDGSGVKTTFKLTIVKQITDLSLKEGLTLDEAGNLFVAGGKSLKLAPMVVISPSDATNKKLTWSVSPNDYGIKISSSGVLSTKKVTKPVTVDIMVTTQDGSGEMLAFRVTVYPV